MLGSSSFTGNQINFDNNGKEIEVPDGQNAAIVSLAGCNSDNSNQVAILNNIKIMQILITVILITSVSD